MTEQMSVNDNNVSEHTLNVGQHFNDYEQLSKTVNVFCKEHYHPFVIRTRSQKQVLYKCCHGIKQNSKCLGKRPNQHYYYKNCKAQINFYKSKNEKWKLTKLLLNHNHTVGKEEYSNYGKAKIMNENDYETATDLILSSAKDGMVAAVLSKKSGKQFIRKDIQNFRNKLFPSCTEVDQNHLMEFLAEIEENGGIYAIQKDAEEEVESLFVASSAMVLNYNKSQCPVIQIDVSFGFNVENYKVLGFCYYSSITDKSEFAAIGFIAKETYSAFIHCMNEFKKICKTHPSVFLIDKDFIEIKAIRDIFSSATVLLCKFHVIKYIKRLVSTAYNKQIDEKHKILDAFKKCLYAQSYKEYEEQKKKFLDICKSVKVFAGTKDKYVTLEEQFLKNWDSCKEMWVHYFRKHLPLMGDTTTNRIERSFWTLKQYIQTKYHSLPTIYLCIKELIDFIDSRIKNKLAKNKQKVFKIMDNDNEIRKLLEVCSEVLTETGMKLFHKQLKLFKTLESKIKVMANGIEENLETGISKIYNTSLEACSCTFWNSFSAPCRHIFMLRKYNNLDIFSKTCFHPRYITSVGNTESIMNMDIDDEDTNDVDIDDIDKDEFDGCQKVLSDREKFNTALTVTKNIADILSNYGTTTFNKYMNELKLIEKNARNGVSLFENEYSEPTISSIEFETSNLVEAGSCQDSLVGTESQNESDTNHKSNENLKFKTKIKSKGRPKRKTKQIQFYKKQIKTRNKK